MKRCINRTCNAELEDYQERCTECGWSQNQKVVEKPAPAQEEEEETPVAERHGCVTTWLWFVIVVNTVASFLLLVFGIFDQESFEFVDIIYGLFGIVTVIGAFMILKWLKIGFYMIVISNVLANIIAFAATGDRPTGLLGLFVLWAVLQIKKNGVSCWKALK